MRINYNLGHGTSHPQESLLSPDPVALHARFRPNALACIDLATDRRWTYRQLDNDIERAVTVLSREGVSHGERVAVLAHNSVHQIILSQALMRLGAIFVPLNWRLSLLELAKLLADCTPTILYTDTSPAPDLPPGCRNINIADFANDIDAASPEPSRPPHSTRSTCLILYTSGTSGVPKGVMLSPSFLLANAINFGVLGALDSGSSVFLADCPMFHVIGIVVQIWPPLFHGGTVVVSPGFNPSLTNERLSSPDLGVTHYFCVPQMADTLRRAANFEPGKWRTLKALFTGGAPNPPATIRWWLEQGVRMVNGFGMTETGTVFGMPMSAESIHSSAGAVGFTGPLTVVRLVDEEEREVADESPGEILVAGPSVMSGYWNRPEERRKAFTEDGWFRTGDIGRRGRDGYVFIVDRRNDMFISGGENIAPVEVEAALIEHSSVREVAVVGVPDARWGEVGCAYMVVAPGERPSAEELTRHCRKLIGRYKVPKQFVSVESLPRTGSGKIMKHVLKKEAIATLQVESKDSMPSESTLGRNESYLIKSKSIIRGTELTGFILALTFSIGPLLFKEFWDPGARYASILTAVVLLVFYAVRCILPTASNLGSFRSREQRAWRQHKV